MPFIPDTPSSGKRSGFIPDKKSLGGFAGNVLSSGLNTIGGIGSSLINVVNPDLKKNTLANLARLGIGTAQLLDPTEVLGTGQQEAARNVGRFYDQRYGLSDLARGDIMAADRKGRNTAYNDPVGYLLDWSTIAGGAGTALKGAGLASKASGLTRAGETLGTISKFSDPFQVASTGAGKIGSLFKGKAGKALEGAGESYITRGLGQPKQLRKIEGLAGQKPGELISKYGAMERTPEAFSQAIDAAGSQLDNLYAAANKNINTGDFLKALDAKIKELDSQSLLSDTARAQRDSLVQRRAQIEQFLGGDKGVALEFSPTTGREMKSNIYKDVRPSTFNPAYAGSGSQLAAKDAYQGLISSIEQAVPGTKQLGREQAALIQLEELAKNARARGAARQPLSLPKVLAGGVGGAVAGIPGVIATMAGESILNSPRFTSLASRSMSGAGKALQTAKTPAIIGKGTNALYRSGTVGRLLTPGQTSEQPSQSIPQPRITTKVPTYPTIVPPKNPVPVKPVITKEIKYKAPKNVFTNKSSFGKTVKIKPLGY